MKKLLIILIILLLPGCYNYKELKDLSIVYSFSIDKKENEYILYVNTIKPGEEKNKIITNTGKGKTIMASARNINNSLDLNLLNSNLEYVLISKEIIKNDLNEVIDYLSRDTRLPFNFLIVTTDDNIDTINNYLTKTSLENLLKISSNKNGYTYLLDFKTLLHNYLSKEKETVYPTVNIEKDKITIGNLIYFNNKEEIKLSKEEALSFNIISNNIKNNLITIKCGNKYFSLEALKSKSKIKNNNLKTYIETKLVSYECDYDLNNINTIKLLENLASKEIKDNLYYTINNMKKDYIATKIKNIETNIKITKEGTLRGDLL